jgi:calcineurin-like phosphoesterase family protein
MELKLDSAIFTSDSHYDQEAALRYGRSCFSSVDEMNETMITKWNALVKPGDTVIHVGDFCFRRRTVHQILPRLNGKIVLVIGNHDEHYLREYHKYNVITTERLTLKIKGLLVECCHYPMFAWKRMKFGSYHVHGHLHGDPHTIPPGRIYDACVENHDYAPFSFDYLHEQLKDKPIREHHVAR